MKLGNVAKYVNDKIAINDVSRNSYVSTDNMLANKGGLDHTSSFPSTGRVTHYKEGDTLVSNIRPYFKKIWFADKKGGCSNDVLVFRSIDVEVIDPHFLYYVLSQDSFFDFVMSGANGTKMPRGNKNQIINYSFPSFGIETQKKIVSLLYPFDHLINNCQTQIKFLEEFADRLFDEWFVQFHFPHNEEISFESGLPKGWKIEKLKNVCSLSAGGDRPKLFSKTPTQSLAVPVYSNGIENDGLFGFTDNAKIVDESVTISARGTIGFVCLRKKPFVPIVRLLCISPKTSNNLSADFIYLHFKNIKIEGNGAATQQVTVPQFKEREILLPDNDTLCIFNDIVKPAFRKIEIIKEQINLLKDSRDHLAKKLLTGELQV